MIKLLGASLIVAATTLAGFFIAQKYAARTEQIRQLQNMFLFMETEIMYGSTPLSVIMKRLAERVESPFKTLFHDIHTQLQHNQNLTFQKCWEDTLNKHWHKTALKDNELQILMQVGASLGLSDRLNQQKHLQMGLIHLQTQEDHAIHEQKKYEKMSRTLGFLMGILIVILMY